MRKYKCYGFCNEKYLKEDLEQIGGKNYCHSCAEAFRQEKHDRAVLYSTIQKVFKIPYPTGFILRQIKDYTDNRNYELVGLTQTIYYFVTIMKKQPYKNSGLSFVPYYYDSAVEYYKKLKERRDNAKDIDTKVETINITKLNSRKNYFKQSKIVDMKGLLEDE